MGAMIKADEMGETRRGMKRKVSRQSQFLRSALVHAVSAFICALVCSYSYWFPWLFCFINHFLRIYLPSVWPLVFGPKCMFVVANAIVLAVVGDWRQTCAKSKNTHQDMYEEYVRRSRGPRRVLVYKKVERKEENSVLVYKKVERKEENSVRKIHAKALEIEKEIVENKEEIAEEFHEDILETEVTNPEETNEELIEEASTSNSKEMEAEAEDSNNSAEKTTASPDEDIKKVKETGSADESQNEDFKKVEETGSNEDELNKRVEDFIARVNKRRWDEANNWLICSA